MLLKICGITNQDDATAAIDAGATAIGFNFYSRSPRYVAPEQAAEIVTAAGVLRAGVFVNESRERVQEIARAARLDIAQLHGDETPADVLVAHALLRAASTLMSTPGAESSINARVIATTAETGVDTSARTTRIWKAVRVDDSFDIADYQDFSVEALLLDGPAGTLYGGAGCSFDWRLVRRTNRKIVLAGGLDASNVTAAIELVRPWGVDACSRIESAPGKKDHKKMTEFLHAATLAAL